MLLPIVYDSLFQYFVGINDNVQQNQTEHGQSNDQIDDSNQYDDNDEELALLQTTLLYNDIMLKQ
jgi:hypothetical protein